MEFFQIRGNLDSKAFITGRWSMDAAAPDQPYPRDQWYPLTDIEFDADFRVTDETREKLRAFYRISTPYLDDPHKTVDDFGRTARHFPAIDIPLSQELKALAPDCVDLIEFSGCIDGRTIDPLAGGPFRLLNVTARADTWCDAEMDIVAVRREGRPTQHRIERSSFVVHKKKVEGLRLWREVRGETTLCDRTIRDAILDSGWDAWRFTPVKTVD